MNAERWKRIDELFQRTLERDPAERSSFLRAEIGEDSELGREVRSLIEASERPGTFLESPAEGGVSRLLSLDDESETSAMIGRRFGAYRVASVIASGGMGTVFLASRDDDAYRKHVAIKLVKCAPGESSRARDRERTRRFTLERQVLAELEHPYIARLLDGGTTDDGRPYFVMEHVEGLPIDEHCTKNGLTPRERLKLFVKVCQGVQHAHQNLIIHRDLKPSNILVTPEGDPKLLDFGLAKLLDPQRSVLASKHTAADQLMGTIAYAAPEQLSGSGQHQDTRSDVYALGVILYRVLTGRHPYSVEGSMSEVLRRITEETPRRPSNLTPRVDEEMDTIVLKALAKEQDRRYQSAGDLAADVERYLAGEPVLAKGDSRWYVLRKTARRYRIWIAMAASLLVMVSAFAAAMSVQAARLADRSDALALALRTSNIERGRAMAAMGSITEAEGVIWGEALGNAGHDPSAWRDDPAAYWALWELYANNPCTLSRTVAARGERFVACSPSGALAAIVEDGIRLRVHDLRTGAEVAAVPSTIGLGRCTVFAPDDLAMLTLEPDGRIVEWSLPSGIPVRQSAPGLAGVGGVIELGPDAARVVVTHEHGVRILDRQSLSILCDIDVPEAVTRHATLNPAGTLVGVACMDGHVRTFDAATGAPIARYLTPEMVRRRYTAHVAFDPSGRYLASDVDGTDVVLIDLERGRAIRVLPEPGGWINDLRFCLAPDGRRLLAAASTDKSAYVWEIPSGRLVNHFPAHDLTVDYAAFTDDGATLTTLCRGTLRRWELERHAGVRRLPTGDTVFEARFSPDRKHILAGCGDQDNSIRIFDAHTGKLERTLPGHTDAVTCITFDPSGDALTCGADGTIRRWRLADNDDAGEVLARTPTPGGRINAAILASDGRTLISTTDEGMVRFWDRADGRLLETFEVGGPTSRIPSAALSPDGRWLALAVSPPNEIVLRDMNDASWRTLPGHEMTLRIVRFSPDGTILASAGDDLSIRLWSMRDSDFGAPLGVLMGHQQDVWAMAFAPDGRTIATSGRSGLVKLWDVASQRCLATLDVHSDMVFSLEFSADGSKLLSGGRDGTVGLWDLAYYERHIAGNLEFHRARLAAKGEQILRSPP